MLHLDDSLVIGKGAHRVCYRHPFDQDKCIKVITATDDYVQRLECKYYQHLDAANISWKHLSRYYGDVETNLGVGYIYELIKDFDESISLPLTKYLNKKKSENTEFETIRNNLAELKKYLVENKIVLRNLQPYNIVIQRTSPTDSLAVIIDNIGHHNNAYHLSDRFAFLARKDIQKKWKKFESGLNYKLA